MVEAATVGEASRGGRRSGKKGPSSRADTARARQAGTPSDPATSPSSDEPPETAADGRKPWDQPFEREHRPPGATESSTADTAESLLAAGEEARVALEVHDALRLLDAHGGGAGIDEQLRELQRQRTLGLLVDAARELQTSLRGLNHDEDFWARLTAAEQSLELQDRAELLRIQEVLDLNLLQVLPKLGYHPPPSEREFAAAIQNSLLDIVGGRGKDPSFARRVTRARAELTWFVVRFDRVVQDAELARGARAVTPEERATATTRTAAWVRRAAMSAGPAAVAAGGVALLAGGPPVAMAAAGAAAFGTEALKHVLQIGAGDLLGQVLGAPGLPEPADLARDLEAAVDEAIDGLAAVVTLPAGHPQREAAVFVAQHAIFRALQAEPVEGGWPELRRAGTRALDLLREPDLQAVVDHWRR